MEGQHKWVAKKNTYWQNFQASCNLLYDYLWESLVVTRCCVLWAESAAFLNPSAVAALYYTDGNN